MIVVNYDADRKDLLIGCREWRPPFVEYAPLILPEETLYRMPTVRKLRLGCCIEGLLWNISSLKWP
jgi:hypothetical protein